MHKTRQNVNGKKVFLLKNLSDFDSEREYLKFIRKYKIVGKRSRLYSGKLEKKLKPRRKNYLSRLLNDMQRADGVGIPYIKIMRKGKKTIDVDYASTPFGSTISFSEKTGEVKFFYKGFYIEKTDSLLLPDLCALQESGKNKEIKQIFENSFRPKWKYARIEIGSAGKFYSMGGKGRAITYTKGGTEKALNTLLSLFNEYEKETPGKIFGVGKIKIVGFSSLEDSENFEDQTKEATKKMMKRKGKKFSKLYRMRGK